ncbi:hypothetical protein Ancab_039334 [Ancistrocladus abbreviatus]
MKSAIGSGNNVSVACPLLSFNNATPGLSSTCTVDCLVTGEGQKFEVAEFSRLRSGACVTHGKSAREATFRDVVATQLTSKCVDNQPIWRDYKVLDINIDGKMTISHNISYDCSDESTKSASQLNVDLYNISLSAGNFTVSANDNKLVAIGCDTFAWIKGYKNETPYWVGCMTYCMDSGDVMDRECSSAACCEACLPYGAPSISTRVGSSDNHIYCKTFNPCRSAFVVAKDAFIFNKTKLSTTLEEYEKNLTVPVVLNWTVGNQTCSSAQANRTCLCQENTTCYEPPNEVGYRCECLHGYEGNPYLSP